jgi:hypothetical protein
MNMVHDGSLSSIKVNKSSILGSYKYLNDKKFDYGRKKTYEF